MHIFQVFSDVYCEYLKITNGFRRQSNFKPYWTSIIALNGLLYQKPGFPDF